ncbi:DotD/TraH family lipoprotein [Sodalis endosymbiont of Spalangia cameroni]|uniref:DotD/TraH family lipoprotein n=1 Tax=Sodalis praecaptivus TaxID=1239307 RepID=UPI0031FA2D24
MKTLFPLAAALWLGGCHLASRPCPLDASTFSVPASVAAVQHRNALLHAGGAINPQTAGRLSSPIRAHSDRVTVDWDGDAVELLSHLARQRGLTFNWTGVRLPLPVNVHARNVTYQNLLRMITLQTAWRATLHDFPGQLTLAFMPQETPR